VRLELLTEVGGTDANEATRRLVRRLLHDPSEALRDLAATDPAAAERAEAVLASLFRLSPEDKT
jgi:glutamyl-tRNA reductase